MNDSKPIMTDKMEVASLDTINILPGGMGLRGLWALIGNSTAMTLLALVLFLMIGQVRAMHEENIVTLKEILNVQIQNQNAVIKQNTSAIRDLASEVRALRIERQNGGK